jgi:hypothetical protein
VVGVGDIAAAEFGKGAVKRFALKCFLQQFDHLGAKCPALGAPPRWRFSLISRSGARARVSAQIVQLALKFAGPNPAEFRAGFAAMPGRDAANRDTSRR